MSETGAPANAPSSAPLLSFRSNFYRSLPKKAVARPDKTTQKNEISKGSLVIDHAKKQTKVAPTKTSEGIYKRGADSPAKDRPVAKPYNGLDYTTTFIRGHQTDNKTNEGKYERGAKSPVKDRPPAAKPYNGKDFTTSFYQNQSKISKETGDDFLKKLEAVEKMETDRQTAEARKPSSIKAQNPGASFSASAVKPAPAPATSTPAPAPASSFFSMMTGGAPAPSPAPAATKPVATGKASGGTAAKAGSTAKPTPTAAGEAAADAPSAQGLVEQIGQLCPCLATVLKPPASADVELDKAAALIQGQASTYIEAALGETETSAAAPSAAAPSAAAPSAAAPSAAEPAAETAAAAAPPEETSMDEAAMVIQNAAKAFVTDSGL